MQIRKVNYGRFNNTMWHRINGLTSVQHVLDRIYMETNMENDKVWTHGTI